jgi:hypothetical protein
MCSVLGGEINHALRCGGAGGLTRTLPLCPLRQRASRSTVCWQLRAAAGWQHTAKAVTVPNVIESFSVFIVAF